jgi:RES domain-containing protein
VPRDTYAGLGYRQCHPAHTDLNETLRASQLFSFRFNPPAEFGVLYVALEEPTAVAELVRRARRSGIPVRSFAPRVMLTLDLRLGKVLDLTDPGVRRAWDITTEDLASDDYGHCQEVARVARRDDYEAIRYPSATDEGDNLAIFYDRCRAASSVVEMHRDELRLEDQPERGSPHRSFDG